MAQTLLIFTQKKRTISQNKNSPVVFSALITNTASSCSDLSSMRVCSAFNVDLHLLLHASIQELYGPDSQAIHCPMPSICPLPSPLSDPGLAMPTDFKAMNSSPATRCSASANLAPACTSFYPQMLIVVNYARLPNSSSNMLLRCHFHEGQRLINNWLTGHVWVILRVSDVMQIVSPGCMFTERTWRHRTMLDRQEGIRKV